MTKKNIGQIEKKNRWKYLKSGYFRISGALIRYFKQIQIKTTRWKIFKNVGKKFFLQQKQQRDSNISSSGSMPRLPVLVPLPDKTGCCCLLVVSSTKCLCILPPPLVIQKQMEKTCHINMLLWALNTEYNDFFCYFPPGICIYWASEISLLARVD